MATWRPAGSLATLKRQLDAMYPARSRASDGMLGDSRHATTKSEHNVNKYGVVTAYDITHSPASGVDCHKLADDLIRDPRTWYVIFNRRIWLDGTWGIYAGANPHTKHLHVSVKQQAHVYDDPKHWNLNNIGGYQLMDEEGAKEAYRAPLYREPENDRAWRPLVGKRPADVLKGQRHSTEWLTNNHILKVAYPQTLKLVEQLKAEVTAANNKPSHVVIQEVEKIVEKCDRVNNEVPKPPAPPEAGWLTKLLAHFVKPSQPNG